jgi:hypothetical protein
MSAVLEERRKVQLEEVIDETRLFSKRADLPEDRMALAEIERALLDLREQWRAEGKLNGQEELPLAVAPRAKRTTLRHQDNGR